MMLFILCHDILMIFLNWELLGLISYLLINYWTNKVNCGIKAILYNRLGDYAFLYLISIIGLIINYYSFITLTLVTFLISFIINFLFNYLLLISLLCILFSKSAQFPFSSWLLYAMNAPTPISALLHSSTMVIASLYLAIIINDLLNLVILYYYFFNYFLFIIPILTLSWAVIKAILINDIKTIIALSTISQLSYMYIALLINPIICLFHIIIHALFKSLLFILSGSIIHNSINYQSQYKIKINQLFIKMLFISSSFILILSLTKEIIIYSSIINYSSIIIGLFLIIGSLFTLFYSIKLIIYLFNWFINSFNCFYHYYLYLSYFLFIICV